MGATEIRLWFLKETDKARLYYKHRTEPGKPLDLSDKIWIPKSVIEHTSIRGEEHTVRLPDWFIEKNGL